MTVSARLLLAGPLMLGVAGASFTTARLLTPPAPLTAQIVAQGSWVPAPGSAPPVAAPSQGSLGVDVMGLGPTVQLARADATTVRPTASVAKTITVLVISEIHPLAAGADGPVITIRAIDVSDYTSIAAAGGSFVPVFLGEHFTERQMLLGLMLPSANNLALTLARWVDGSVAAFVARLNARAAKLGMSRSHFADPDGLDSATVSTAADLLLLGEAAVANDTVVSVVSTVTATLPDGTALHNLDQPLVDDPGWIGVKTGWTPDAGGCLLFAARRTLAPGTPALTVVGVVLGQPPDAAAGGDHPELGGAFAVARAAVETAFAGYAAVRVGPGSIPVTGTVTAPWGVSSDLVVAAGPDTTLLLRLGDSLSLSVDVGEVSAPAAAGTDAASVRVASGSRVLGTWRVVTAGPLDEPSASWRLLHA